MWKTNIIRNHFLIFLAYTLICGSAAFSVSSNSILTSWPTIWAIHATVCLVAGIVFLTKKDMRHLARFYFLSVLMLVLLLVAVAGGFWYLLMKSLPH